MRGTGVGGGEKLGHLKTKGKKKKRNSPQYIARAGWHKGSVAVIRDFGVQLQHARSLLSPGRVIC